MSDLFGVVGVFASSDAVKSAARLVRDSGYRAFDAFTPYPVEGLDEITGSRPGAGLPLMMFVGGVAGAACGYFIQYWDEALDYPINVGGRPYNSWPAFIVSAFEFMVLFAVGAGFFGLLVACRLPKLYRPISEARSFVRASRDRYLICVEVEDPKFDLDAVMDLFRRAGAERIEEVWA